MSIVFTDPDADFEAVADLYRFPTTAQPDYFNLFNNAAKLDRNMVSGDVTPWVVGNPDVADEFMQTSSADYIMPGLQAPTGNFSILVVAEALGDRSEYLFSNYINNTTPSFSIFLSAATAADNKVRPQFGIVQNNAGTLTHSIGQIGAATELTVGVPFCIFASYNATTRARYAKSMTTGAVLTDTLTYPMAIGGEIIGAGPATVPVANLPRVGWFAGAISSSNPTGMYAAAFWHSLVPSIEAEQAYAQLQTYFAGKGVTI